MAGFQVIMTGWIWVFTEALFLASRLAFGALRRADENCQIWGSALPRCPTYEIRFDLSDGTWRLCRETVDVARAVDHRTVVLA